MEEGNFNVGIGIIADEQGIAYFQVERSKDGQTDWQILNKIDSKGDSSTSSHYETLDDLISPTHHRTIK